MSHTPGFALILVFAPLNNITAQFDHKKLRLALHNAINCSEVPGDHVPLNRLDAKYITIASGEGHLNGIAFHLKKKHTPGAFEMRLPLLVSIETRQPLGDFSRALGYQNL